MFPMMKSVGIFKKPFFITQNPADHNTPSKNFQPPPNRCSCNKELKSSLRSRDLGRTYLPQEPPVEVQEA